MPSPVVKATATAKSATEIDVAATVTGLSAGEAVTITVTAVSGVSGTASVSATTPVTPPPSPSAVTWAPSTAFPLSDDKLTAMCGGTVGIAVATVGKASGKWYWKVKAVKAGPNFAVGLVNAKAPISGTFLGGLDGGNGVGFYSCYATQPLSFWVNNNLYGPWYQGLNGALDVDSAEYRQAWDADKHLWWVQTPAMVSTIGAKAWNNQANADPATGVGGIDVSAFGAELWPVLGMAESGSAGLLEVTGLIDAPAGFVALN